MSFIVRFSFALLIPTILTLACSKEGGDVTAQSPLDSLASPAPGPYRISLIPEESDQIPGRDHTLRFRIVDEQEKPLIAYRIVHEKPLHLIVARKDLGTFQHVHPEFEEATRKWIVPLTFETFGPHALFADFHPDLPGAAPIVVRRDYFVGDTTYFRPLSWSKETLGPQPVDGFTVDVSAPTAPLESGSAEQLRFAWTDDAGRPAALDPHLGSFGHVVALRAGSLAYQHVHPDSAASAPAQGVAVFVFHPAEPGVHRVFAQFRVGDTVHTVPVTLLVAETGPGGEVGTTHAGH